MRILIDVAAENRPRFERLQQQRLPETTSQDRDQPAFARNYREIPMNLKDKKMEEET